MKIQQQKRFIVLYYMVGFILGILYANFFAKENLISTSIFSDYFLSQYVAIEIITEEYLMYIVQIRLLPLILFLIAAQTKYRKIVGIICFLWSGFSSGIFLVTSIIQLGIKGILFCMIGLTPHFFFYILAYLILLWHCYFYPRSEWNKGKTIAIIVFMGLGIVLEVYVNPILMKLYVNAL